uniref:Uncharacterized protein LOC114327708 n=1 Tax=Diabrotica virgifera virgifera TaxID=50390 RepID=A0A6P7F9I0_DIAVI
MTTNNTIPGRRRLLKDFYRSVILSEKCAVTFLREHGLLDEADDNQPCHRCGSVMQQKTRSDRGKEARLVLRCPRKGCQVTRSVRTGNEYFHNFYTDLNDRVSSKLSLCGMLEIMFFFVEDIPLTTTVQLTGKATDTVTEWYNMFREICAAIVSSRDLMVGTIESPIQIDETRFDGYRKYKRKRKSEDGTGESEDSDDKEENHRNHGERIDGPWLFGLKNRTDCRYFFVERRDEETLVPIIQMEVASGSVINSDESPAYANLNELGFEHWTTTTVNHQRHFMDPVSETHTQRNERSALDAKIIMKKMRGVPRQDLQSHLNEYCWRILRKDEEDLFLTFLSDVKQVYT